MSHWNHHPIEKGWIPSIELHGYNVGGSRAGARIHELKHDHDIQIDCKYISVFIDNNGKRIGTWCYKLINLGKAIKLHREMTDEYNI